MMLKSKIEQRRVILGNRQSFIRNIATKEIEDISKCKDLEIENGKM